MAEVRSHLVFSFQMVIFLGCLFLSISASAANAAPFSDRCTSTSIIDFDRSVHINPIGTLQERHCYRLDVSSPGDLLLSVMPEEVGEVEPKILFLGQLPVTKPHGEVARVHEGSRSHLLLSIFEEGSYYFDVSAEKPDDSLVSYVLTNRFIGEDSSAGKTEIRRAEGSGRFTKNEDPGEIDPDIGSIVHGEGGGTSSLELHTRKSGLLIIDLGEGSEGELSSIEPGKRMGGMSRVVRAARGKLVTWLRPGQYRLDLEDRESIGSAEVRFRYFDLCSPREEVAASRLFSLCAMSLDLGATVALASPYEADGTFSFLLRDRQTVRIVTEGERDTFGVLYDAEGHRLATDEDGGERFNFRIVKSLGPGRYFVRAGGRFGLRESAWLTVEKLNW